MIAYLLISIGCAWGMSRLVSDAPEGYQDDTGFHYGPEPK